jgi:5'-nucleotidase
VTPRPLILVTNDDGIHSPGLHAAAEAVADLGDLLIVAPLTGQTSMSRAIVAGPEMGAITPVELDVAGRSVLSYAVTGSPAMAVNHAMLELVDRRPALCVSGVNYGENIGGGLGVSGTIGAAMQAVSFDVPSLAASLQVDVADWHASDSRDWDAAIHFTRLLATQILSDGLPEPVAVVNLNVPRHATSATELRMTTQSRLAYYVQLHPGERVLSDPVRLGVATNVIHDRIEAGSDVEAVVLDHVVSVTPLSWSMTAATDWLPRV